jgi:FkbM family methyltransferase
VGYFGVFAAARWPLAQIRAYEADPQNIEVLERTIAANGLRARWQAVAAAAGAHDGTAALAAGRAMGSYVLEPGADPSVAAIEVPVEDVMSELGGADLVKIDIEGSEWELLSDPRFTASPPRALVLEYHPRLCPGPDPRAKVQELLAAASLSTASIWHSEDGHGMLWAWRG